MGNFTHAVCAAQVKRGHLPMHWGANDLNFRWNGKSFCFHANIPDLATNRTQSPYSAPSDTGSHGKGRNISAAPSYADPHLNAELLSNIVTLSYSDYMLDYKFVDGADAIGRRVDHTQ